MGIVNTQPYEIDSEANITEVLSHFDSKYIFDILDEKLENLNRNFYNTLKETNIVASYEATFKLMEENFPGDIQNIKLIRQNTYQCIIKKLTERFNLEFNYSDENINLYTAAHYLYDFLICSRNDIMINFFAAFMINNKDSLCNIINAEDIRKNKDSSVAYGKRLYEDNKYALISANISTVINYISTLDIRLINIFQSTYPDPTVVAFLDNAFADRGNFFRDYYCALFAKDELKPKLITDIRLLLNRLVGNISQSNINEFMSYGGEIGGESE